MKKLKKIKRFKISLLILFCFCLLLPVSAPAQEAAPPAGLKAAVGEEGGATAEDDELAELLGDDFEEDEERPAEELADPLYYMNKGIFYFNDKLYLWVMKPVAVTYRAVVPKLFRTGLQNFYDNLKTPIRLVNCLLQGKTEAAGVELGRFMVNTVVGVLGFGNPADNEPNLKRPPEEDLGQTLGLYGIGNGFYLVIPIIGPSTLRDSIGILGGTYVDPVYYAAPNLSPFFTASERLNWLSFHINDYETLVNSSVDPYESFKDIYFQYRQKAIKE